MFAKNTHSFQRRLGIALRCEYGDVFFKKNCSFTKIKWLSNLSNVLVFKKESHFLRNKNVTSYIKCTICVHSVLCIKQNHSMAALTLFVFWMHRNLRIQIVCAQLLDFQCQRTICFCLSNDLY